MDYKSLSDDDLLALLKAKETEYSQLNSLQNAAKTALNSLYGACGNKHFRYFNSSIAEGITQTGQVIIQYISNSINSFLGKQLNMQGTDFIIANDTDSAYIELVALVEKVCGDIPPAKIVDFIDKFSAKFLMPFIDSEFVRLSDYLNFVGNHISMKREVIADKAIWRGKKNYVIQVWDNEGVRYSEPDLKCVGVEAVRSSTPKIAKDALKVGYDILLNGTQEALLQHVKDFKETFMKAEMVRVAFPRGVSDMDKWFDKHTMWKVGTPIHVKACISYNHLLDKTGLGKTHVAIHNGNKIKFIYLKEPNPTGNNCIAFIDELPAGFGLNSYIDMNTQFDKVFLSPLKSFAELVGWDVVKVSRLDDLFSDEPLITHVDVPVTIAPEKTVSTPVIAKRKPENRTPNEPKAYAPKPSRIKKKPDLTSLFE